MSDWYASGVDAAHEDAAQKGDPCDTIDEAHLRVRAWLRGTDNVSGEDIEACAQGYLAGWAAALRERGER